MYLIIILFLILIYIFHKWLTRNTPLDELIEAQNYHINNDGYNALRNYKICLNNDLTNNYELHINIAKIYHYGLEDTEPNVDRAIYHYNQFLDFVDATDQHDKYLSQYKDILIILKDIEKVKHENVNIDINEYYAPIPADIVEPFVEDPLVEPNRRYNIRRNMAPEPFRNPVYQIEPYQDPQNVHSPYINISADNGIEAISNNTNKKYSYDEIKQLILNNTPTNKKNKITQVLQQIDTDMTTRNNQTLKDTLTIIGNNILTSNDKEYKQTGISNLTNELNDCIENNNVVCFTGVRNRLINSISMLNPQVQLKDKDSFNNEMLNKASLIRADLEKTMDPNNTDFDKKLKENIEDQLKKDYVESGILKQTELDDIKNEWIDYI